MIDAQIEGGSPTDMAEPDLSRLPVQLCLGLPMASVPANVKRANSGGRTELLDVIAGKGRLL
ncbi:MAG: hypothetical protein OXF56_04035 [Rhodobacteraceae bacterium]|nr:hypothetical protein [Paracoccaceae bacterium]